MPILNLAELRSIAAADTRPAYKDVEVPQWPGFSVRIRRLGAAGLAGVIDLWADLPKDEDGAACATMESLVEFYVLLLADTVVDESNMPLFANADDQLTLRRCPAALLFLGNEARQFNSDLLAVEDVEKKSEDQPDNSALPLPVPLASPTPTT